MELLHVILEALGFSLCLGGMILLYARICMQHRNIERINGKLDMIRLHDLKRIREELAEKKKDSAVEFTKVYRDVNMGEYERLRESAKKHGIFIDDTCKHEHERLNKCKHEHVVEVFDTDLNTNYYECLDCGKCHSTPFGTVRNRGGLR